MHVSADVVRMHLDYTAWASQHLLDGAAGLTEEERNRDFGSSEHSFLGTLLHVFGADRIWLYRVAGGENPGGLSPADRNLAVLQNDWPAVLERWRIWAAELTDEATETQLDYRDLKGNPYRQPIWQVVLHVVNHATHHRGQAVGFLRAMGKVPPSIDLIYYYRQLGAGTQRQG